MSRFWLLCLALPMLAACGSAPLLEITLRDAPVLIDGQAGEWAGGIQYVEKAGLSVGAQLGPDALDLVLVTADPGLQMQILNLGLTVWIDAEGGEERRFGLRYPAHELAGGFRPERAAGDRRERLEQILASLGGDFLLLEGKDDDGRLMMAGGRSGFDLAMGLDGPRLVYELRIPLATDPGMPRALEFVAGDLGLGLETLTSDREGVEGKVSSMAGNLGGAMGGGRGRGSGSGNMPSGPRPDRPDFLEAWIKLRFE